jgi:hypothetical protein
VNQLAERMLLHADRLVSSLENSTVAGSLHVINVAGRQRMLSQRVAKQALLTALLSGDAVLAAQREAEQARAAFEEAMVYLRSAPLSAREITESLGAAERTWSAMVEMLPRVHAAAGPRALLEASEALLVSFEQLTERYERSMQILMG